MLIEPALLFLLFLLAGLGLWLAALTLAHFLDRSRPSRPARPLPPVIAPMIAPPSRNGSGHPDEWPTEIERR